MQDRTVPKRQYTDEFKTEAARLAESVEPAIGHLKADCRMNRCWLKGSIGDALHALSCAVGYNLRWLMRAVVRLGLAGFLFALLLMRWMTSLASRYVVYEPRAAHSKRVQA